MEAGKPVAPGWLRLCAAPALIVAGGFLLLVASHILRQLTPAERVAFLRSDYWKAIGLPGLGIDELRGSIRSMAEAAVRHKK